MGDRRGGEFQTSSDRGWGRGYDGVYMVEEESFQTSSDRGWGRGSTPRKSLHFRGLQGVFSAPPGGGRPNWQKSQKSVISPCATILVYLPLSKPGLTLHEHRTYSQYLRIRSPSDRGTLKSHRKVFGHRCLAQNIRGDGKFCGPGECGPDSRDTRLGCLMHRRPISAADLGLRYACGPD